jgi:Skp family chaperone for outer membrane proteins
VTCWNAALVIIYIGPERVMDPSEVESRVEEILARSQESIQRLREKVLGLENALQEVRLLSQEEKISRSTSQTTGSAGSTQS